jgi:1,4-alpha-glucan branching enzyme
MATQTVEFHYITGLKRPIFRNARLQGSWDGNGRYSNAWTESPMLEVNGEDGCPSFTASIALDRADRHGTFRWAWCSTAPHGSNFWGIPAEVNDVDSVERYREFRLSGVGTPVERYYFTYGRRLGANKHFIPGNATPAPVDPQPQHRHPPRVGREPGDRVQTVERRRTGNRPGQPEQRRLRERLPRREGPARNP